MKALWTGLVPALVFFSCQSPTTPLVNRPTPASLQTQSFAGAGLQQASFRIQAIPEGASLVVLRASGSNLSTPLVKLMMLQSSGLAAGFLDSQYMGLHSLAFQLPVGSAYLIEAEARNNLGQALARGSTTASVTANGLLSRTITLTAIPLNQPPQIQTLTAQPDALAGAGHATRLNCQATDPDNDSLSYSWSTVGGNFGSFSSTSANQVFWTAPAPASSSYTLRCSVSDGTHTVTQDRVISVSNNSGSITGNGGLY